MINSEQLKAEIEQFKTEAMKMHVVQVWAESYKNSDPFGYVITEAIGVFWVKEQARQLWQFWQSAKQSPQAEIDSLKAQLAKLDEGWVMVPKEPSERFIYIRTWIKFFHVVFATTALIAGVKLIKK